MADTWGSYRYRHCQTNNHHKLMNPFNQNNSILEMLDGLSPSQREKVISMIRTMARTNDDAKEQENFKREAMKQINLALGKDRTLRPFF